MKLKKKEFSRGIFIRNVNYIADINDIDIFLTNYIDREAHNDIILLKDRSDVFTGKIVIIFDNEQLAKKAIIKLNNVVFLNRKLKVTYAFNKYLEINNSYNKNNISLDKLFNNNLNLI
jgi:RNA recognition motif-containing protein